LLDFLIGGMHPANGSYYPHYHLDGMGWGGRYRNDGNSACNAPHSNCANTPIEVFETRFPFRHTQYRLRPDSGGAGRKRGGLGIIREFEVLADEVTVSALYERMRVEPWGIRGGKPGARTELLIRLAGSTEFRPFGEVFHTTSPSKFTNVASRRGDRVMIKTPGGGGYGRPGERPPEALARDIQGGWVTSEGARRDYEIGIGRS